MERAVWIALFRGKHFSFLVSPSPAFTSVQECDHTDSSQGQREAGWGQGLREGPPSPDLGYGFFLLHAACVLNGISLINEAKEISFQHFPHLSSETSLSMPPLSA